MTKMLEKRVLRNDTPILDSEEYYMTKHTPETLVRAKKKSKFRQGLTKVLGAGVLGLASLGFFGCPNPVIPSPPKPTPPKLEYTLDLSSIQSNYLQNLDEGQTYTGITLPATATDSSGNTVNVTYTGVESLDSGVAAATFSGGNTFDLTGESTSTDQSYTVRVSFVANGEAQTQDVTGEEFDRPDIVLTSSGALVDDETHSTPGDQYIGQNVGIANQTHLSQTGVLRFYDLNNNPLNVVNGVAGDSGYTNQMDVPANGQVSVMLADRSKNLTGILMQAKMIDSNGNNRTFWSTYQLPTGDTSIPNSTYPRIAVVPFDGKYPIGDLNSSGTVDSSDYQVYINWSSVLNNGVIGKFLETGWDVVQQGVDGSTYTNNSQVVADVNTVRDIISGAADGGPQLRTPVTVYNDATMADAQARGAISSYTTTKATAAAGWAVVSPVNSATMNILTNNTPNVVGTTFSHSNISLTGINRAESYILGGQAGSEESITTLHEMGLAGGGKAGYLTDKNVSSVLGPSQTITHENTTATEYQRVDKKYMLNDAEEAYPSQQSVSRTISLTDLKGEQ